MDARAFEKFSITLPGELARIIHERVGSGAYGSVSEVIREALRAWMQREHRLSELDAAIARGLADADAGRVHDPESVRRELHERFGPKT